MFSFLQSAPQSGTASDEDVAQSPSSRATSEEIEIEQPEPGELNDENVNISPDEVNVPKNWNDAHDAYCRAHHILRASTQQVLHDLCEEDQEIPWELPTRGTVVTDAEQLWTMTQHAHSTTSTTSTTTSATPTTSSSVFSLTKRLASGILSALYTEEHELSDWQQPDDDAFADPGTTTGSGTSTATATTTTFLGLDLNHPIIHVALTTQCLNVIQTQTQTSEDQASDPRIIAESEWHQWCSQIEDDVLGQLSVTDTDWLLQLLVSNHQAKILRRENLTNLIVLSKKDEKDLQVLVALWDLRLAKHRLEEQLHKWADQVNECNQKALLFKRQQQTSLALAQLAKRKMIQERIDTSTQTLINLEQTQTAIETAHSNKATVELLSQSSIILGGLTQQTSLEQIEQVRGDLQSELYHHTELQTALAGGEANMDDDDEELWKELQDLSIKEEPSAPTTKTETSTEEPEVELKTAKDLERSESEESAPGKVLVAS
jgi:hypothetical protein